ncbi:MAG: mobile mystery protein A [Gammaproteobacteria bacterium]|nr:mobile mystery protein A [Gammaproteobacteria bacterium]
MSKFKQMQLQTLDKHLAQVSVPGVPSGGWIRAIRSGVGMSIQQLATRIGIAKQSVARLENNEADDSITLKTLRKAAEALDCQLVYVLVPNKNGLQGIVEKQALLKAKEIVSAVDHTMQLEAQGVGNAQAKIKETAEELAKSPNTKLWD